MKKKCLALLTVAATMSVASTSFAAMAGANTVNSAAIVNGQVMTADLANGAVTATQLAAGAVTDAKITGPISTSKLNVGTASGTVAAGNHNHDGLYQKKYGNVIVVATSGGDYSDPVAALNSIADASATNPYLVKIMPGVYNTGVNLVQMKAFVDVEGSGESTTKILGGGGAAGMAVVAGASDAELRWLTVEYAGVNPGSVIKNLSVSPKISHVTAVSSNGGSAAIMNWNASPILTDVTVISKGFMAGGYGNVGIQIEGGLPRFYDVNVDVTDGPQNFGIINYASAATFRDLSVAVNSPGIGIYNDSNGTPAFDGATITVSAYPYSGGSNALESHTGTVRINNSKISASYAVANTNSTTFISNTLIDGGFSGAGLNKCASVYDGNLNTLVCP